MAVLEMATVTYKYNSCGNFETVKKYPFTHGDMTHSPETAEKMELEHENEIWLDGVTQQDDYTFFYDSQSNLVRFFDCDINQTNSWQLGISLFHQLN